MKIREIYTVVREYSARIPEQQELLDQRFSRISLEPSKILYEGSPKEELSVKFQIYNNNEWQDFNPKE